MKKNNSHCVLNYRLNKLLCLHCGGSFDLQFPIPLTQVSKTFGAFGKLHEFCVKEDIQIEEGSTTIKDKVQNYESVLRELKLLLKFDDSKIIQIIDGTVECQIERLKYLQTESTTKPIP